MRFKIVFIEIIHRMSSIDSTIQCSLCESYHLILQPKHFAVVYYISIILIIGTAQAVDIIITKERQRSFYHVLAIL